MTMDIGQQIGLMKGGNKMTELKLEVTDELLAKLQKSADDLAVTPADVAISILAWQFKEKRKCDSSWLPYLEVIIRGITAGIQGLTQEEKTSVV